MPDGGHPATFEEQVRQAMKNVEATLKQAGLDFRHVVMSHVFLDKYENLEVANRVYNEFFEDGNEPACATVFVDWIPGGSHVEVTCIATTDLSARKVVRPAGMKDRLHRRVRVGAVRPSGPGTPCTCPGCPASSSRTAPSRASSRTRSIRWPATTSTILEAAGLRLEDIVSGMV